MFEFKEKIVISIVAFESLDYLKQCLDSLKWIEKHENIIISIVDNSDSDDIYAFLEKEENNQLTIIYEKAETNKGFGAGHNIAYSKLNVLEAEYFLLVNPDMTLTEEAVHQMLELYRSNEFEKVGIIGPQLRDSKNVIENSVLSDPSALRIGFSMLLELLSKKRTEIKTPTEVTNVLGVSGACMLINTKLIKEIGFFNEKYFMYHEDNDLCKRAIDNGWEILYSPESVAKHFLGTASESIDDRENWKREMNLFGLLTYFKDNKGFIQTLILKASWLLGLLLRIILNKERTWAKSIFKRVLIF